MAEIQLYHLYIYIKQSKKGRFINENKKQFRFQVIFFKNQVIHDLQEIKHKDTEKLKVIKTNQMKTDSVLISDKMDFKAKTIVGNKMITTYWIRIFF